MNFSVKIFMIVLILYSYKAESIDDFYDYVTGIINETKSYKSPTNNEKLFSTSSCSAKIQNFGTFDFVIVGSGSAGALMASRLSEIKEWKVLLLEAGGDQTKFTDVPAFTLYLPHTDMDWGYFSTPQTTCCLGMKNKQCVYPQGKVLGGSTTLNGAIYSRGIPNDFTEWVAAGNPGWSFEEVLPYFKKSEYVALDSYEKPYHGTTGELYVNFTSPPSIIAEAFTNANKEKGLNEVDYNGKSQVGVSRIQLNIKDNIHHNSARAFLNSTLQASRNNLKILLNAPVSKLIIKHGKVKGVNFVKDGVWYKVKATKEVILSAGAINSPQLLMLSGVGPEDELTKLGIPVINNLPAVGKYLHDRPIYTNIHYRTNLSSEDNLKNNIERYYQGMTPLTNGCGLEQIVFISLDNDTTKGDIELYTSPPSFGITYDKKESLNFKEDYSNVFEYNTKTDLTIMVSLMKPKSKGTVTLKSNSVLDFPLINLNYFSDPDNEDLETFYKGIKYTLSLEDTDAFKKIDARFIGKQPECEHLKNNDREYWYCALRHTATSGCHPAGTTRMGPTPNDSVVDTNCLVHNIKNLRVVDGGVFPIKTRGHPNAVIYMIAEKISDVIKRTHGIVL